MFKKSHTQVRFDHTSTNETQFMSEFESTGFGNRRKRCTFLGDSKFVTIGLLISAQFSSLGFYNIGEPCGHEFSQSFLFIVGNRFPLFYL